MEKLTQEFVQDIIKDKKSLIELKNFAVRNHHFEMAAKLREIEREKFPPTVAQKSAKKLADELTIGFRLLDMDVPAKQTWMIHELIKVYMKKKGEMDLKDTSKIKRTADQLFS